MILVFCPQIDGVSLTSFEAAFVLERKQALDAEGTDMAPAAIRTKWTLAI
jgi:hypothetical protein